MDNFFLFSEIIEKTITTDFYFALSISFIILLLLNSLGIPGNIIFIASSGYFFGIYFGFIISILAISLGSIIFISFFSNLIKKIFPIYFSRYSNKANNYISKSSIEYLIIFRIIPGPPLIIQNLILSILEINKVKIFITTILGFSPFVFLLAFIGNTMNGINSVSRISFYEIFSYKFFIVILIIITILIIRIKYK